ncbi:MAG: hypothetical protein DMD91_00645 [Candidatus Rokuibacteriota bacterium]|nr:MAG: hypothetical protein DMD91_00645 [Candidatus Rokubacteria bacterium]
MKTITRLLLVTTVTLGHAAPASAVTADEFRLRSGADVVALCATPASDPLYTAAIHMCHGFGAGTFQTLMALTRHEKLAPLICPPVPSPPRNETVGRFLEWAKRNPERLTDPAVEVVGRFFITEFPCRPQ